MEKEIPASNVWNDMIVHSHESYMRELREMNDLYLKMNIAYQKYKEKVEQNKETL